MEIKKKLLDEILDCVAVDATLGPPDYAKVLRKLTIKLIESRGIKIKED